MAFIWDNSRAFYFNRVLFSASGMNQEWASEIFQIRISHHRPDYCSRTFVIIISTYPASIIRVGPDGFGLLAVNIMELVICSCQIQTLRTSWSLLFFLSNSNARNIKELVIFPVKFKRSEHQGAWYLI